MDEILRKTFEIIEDDIDGNLNLEAISDRIGYSKFHFHRLFLKDMGISVIDYVRRRRIVRSSYELLNTNSSVTSIALSVGFSNVDTYIRGFKNYYGITPRQFRNYKNHEAEINVKECSMMKDLICELKNCTIEEKKEAIKAVESIIQLSRLAHKNGLLFLQTESKNVSSDFLSKAIELLLDGTEPARLRNILYSYVASSKLSNQELLENIIYIEGIMMIQEGLYPWELLDNLKSLFGIDSIQLLEDYFLKDNNLEVRLGSYSNTSVDSIENKAFDVELKRIDKRSMQRLLRECNLVVVGIAFYGASKLLREMAVDSLPKKKLANMLEAIDLLNDISSAQMIDSQNEILRIYKELRVAGEVI